MLQSSIIKFTNKWLRSIDILCLSLLLCLMTLGILFVTTASPSIAKLKGLEEFYFIKKHCIFLILSFIAMLLFSFFSERGIINISYIGLFISLMLILFLFLTRNENNGSVRWIKISGFSFQPTELLKPFLLIILSYLINFF